MERFWQIIRATRKDRAIKWGGGKLAPIFFWCLFAAFCVVSRCNSTKAEDQEKTAAELLNQERRARNIQPLELDHALCLYASKHAEKMASKGNLHHSSMKDLQKSSGSNSVAENIATGRYPEEVVDNWMSSSGHRRNILGKSYRKVGVGFVRSSDGTIYWCAVFSTYVSG